MIRIGIRDDLNMPLGKEVSQCAHALCAYLLGLRDPVAGAWRVPPEEIDEMIRTMKIERVPHDSMSDATIVIRDAGHTVFNGVPTVTTCLFADPDPRYVPNAHEDGAPTDIRMVLCATKEFRRGQGKGFLHSAVSAYGNHLRAAIDGAFGERQEWLDRWCSGSFAKITLNSAPDQLPASGAAEAEPCSATEVAPGCLVLGPAPKSVLEPRTGSMRLL